MPWYEELWEHAEFKIKLMLLAINMILGLREHIYQYIQTSNENYQNIMHIYEAS